MLAVQVAGLVTGYLLGRHATTITTSRLARDCYFAVAALLVLRAGAFSVSLLTSHAETWRLISSAIGDITALIFGLLFGLAIRRPDARAFLTDNSVLDALRMVLAFTFIFASLGKALTLSSMAEFFTQSRYSASFLKFIVLAEAFGALGLLLRWAVVPAMLGLSVDMFGAVLTHIHNSDPLNDSTGAIGLLIRLVALGVLWVLRPQEENSRRTVAASVIAVSAAMLACLLLAAAGSMAMRNVEPPPSSAGGR